MNAVRPPAVAGMFYPRDPKELNASVRYYLAEAAESGQADGSVPKAIIAPHAGYIYSGFTAACAYTRLVPAADKIKRVVMMGPCHQVGVSGIALPEADAFATPLGEISIDADAVRKISHLPFVQVFDATHKDDHCLEVHLPFLQSLLSEFTIVPMIVGQATTEQVAEVLEILWGGPETLILISSDLSHYLPYDKAKQTDGRAGTAIEALDPLSLEDHQACGRHSIKGLLTVAKQKGLAARTVDMRNSGDTAGSRDRVVGYGSWIFQEPDGTSPTKGGFEDQTRALLSRHGESLLKLAGQTVKTYLADGKQHTPNVAAAPAELARGGASFVTVEKEGKLRGCIGSLGAARPLVLDVAENAFRAAFKDHRFPPLSREEFETGNLSLTVTVLSDLAPIAFSGEADLVQQLRPGTDGLLIEANNERGVFLPVVWESIREPREFLKRLKQKAGFAPDYWCEGLKAWRFITVSVHSTDLRNPDTVWR